MPATYYYLDIDLKSGAVVDVGTSPTANHTGQTSEANVHRVFLTKGQFNKLAEKLEKESGA